MTELIHDAHYFELQKHVWQAYYDIGIQENLWTSQLTTNSTMAQSKTYFLPQQLIEHRQKTILHQLQRTTNEFYQSSVNLERDTQQWQPSIGFNILIQIVTQCVNKHQYPLPNK